MLLIATGFGNVSLTTHDELQSSSPQQNVILLQYRIDFRLTDGCVILLNQDVCLSLTFQHIYCLELWLIEPIHPEDGLTHPELATSLIRMLQVLRKSFLNRTL